MSSSNNCFRVTKSIEVIDSNKISKKSLNALKLILLKRILKGSVMADLCLSVKNSIH